MTPAFSVIIAVYNGAKTVGRAIESVLAQTQAAHEIIVVDDGSTDATGAAVKQFGAAVRYVHQPNAGASAARNAGARLASGDWLAFLDADDVYYPDRLRLHAQWIMRGPDLDFLTGDQEYRLPDGTLLRKSMESTEAGRYLLNEAQGRAETVMEQDEAIALFVEDHFGDTHTLSVPRLTFLELDGYPTGFSVCEDVSFLIRLCARSKRIGVVCRPMAVYYIYENSATRRDPLRSQQLTVDALLALRPALADARSAIRRGWVAALRRARRNLAYALLRQGRRFDAVRAVLPSLLASPGRGTMRDVLSVARGPRQKPPPTNPAPVRRKHDN